MNQPVNTVETQISLLAISVSNLSTVRATQTELPLSDDPRRAGSATGTARSALDSSMDAVRRRFGPDAVGYLPAALARSGVPDEFRELAERDL